MNNEMYYQVECTQHEYVEVKMTSTETSAIKSWYQCRLCGKFFNDTEPKINEIPVISIPE